MKNLTLKFRLLTVVLFSVAVFFLSTAGHAKVVKINSIDDIKSKNYNNFQDTFLIHPDVGSEINRISSELYPAKILSDFLRDKKATGKKLDIETGTYYLTFQFHKDARQMTWTEKMADILDINSKLTDLMEKNLLLN